jgi:hypothetical protein
MVAGRFTGGTDPRWLPRREPDGARGLADQGMRVTRYGGSAADNLLLG